MQGAASSWRSVAGALLGVVLPLVVISGMLFLRPIMLVVAKESQRTKKMLLLLPLEVIDKVPAIQDYLLSGQAANQNKIEAALKETEERTRSLLYTAADGVIEFDEGGIITEWNKMAAELFGREKNQMLGAPIYQLFTDGQPLEVWMKQVKHNKRSKGVNQDQNVAGKRKGRRKKKVDDRNWREDGAGKSFELTCVRSAAIMDDTADTNMFAGMVSVSYITIAGELLFSAFVRDISLEKQRKALLMQEKQESDHILHNILPDKIAQRLTSGEELVADRYENTTIIYLDILGVPELASKVAYASESERLVTLLNSIINEFDDIAMKYKLEKIKTINSSYLIISGVPQGRFDHADAAIKFAIECLAYIVVFNQTAPIPIKVKIGINTGEVVAGVIGVKKFAFDIWGDSVNVACRLAGPTCPPNRIQVSRSTYEHLFDKYTFEERGEMQVKGKGTMQLYLYAP
eukprot:TRINITY_DN62909_c0_g1_i1.p1 TRINITY_DN62909_c0_g1~~TRINITY_DN62909_c0_g1_i1.p1  ORF type:complete len:520 (-),score=22.73 TRINITY_DN62909_c0_g1_i1:1132-2511(-)